MVISLLLKVELALEVTLLQFKSRDELARDCDILNTEIMIATSSVASSGYVMRMLHGFPPLLCTCAD